MVFLESLADLQAAIFPGVVLLGDDESSLDNDQGSSEPSSSRLPRAQSPLS